MTLFTVTIHLKKGFAVLLPHASDTKRNNKDDMVKGKPGVESWVVLKLLHLIQINIQLM